MNQLQLHISTWMNLKSNVEWENQVKEEYRVWFLYVNMEKNKSILFRNTYGSGRTLREVISTEIIIVFTSTWGQMLRGAA